MKVKYWENSFQPLFLVSVMIVLLIVLLTDRAFSVTPQQANEVQSQASFQQIVIDKGGIKDPWLKTVGDINGDGFIDLVAGGRSSGGLVWYENPNWTEHSISAKNGFSTDGEVADVDKDGDLDILALTTSNIVWFENPSWTEHLVDNRTLHDLEVSDFDGDGDIDIVARDQGEFGHQGDELHFYRQESPISWTHRSVSIANGEGLRVSDLDRDGDEDVVINGSWLENSNDILNGLWTEYKYTSSWTHPNAFVATGDINKDGRQDIALSPAELAGQKYRISWFEAPANPKSGNWTEHIVADNVEAVIHFVGIADMDSDGAMDIAAAEMHQGTDPDDISIYINEDGNGQTWTKAVVADTGSHSMRILDIDKDGDMDLYGANWRGTQVELYKNLTCSDTPDSWRRHVIDAAKPWTSIFITSADVDGDHHMDIITGGWWYKNPGKPDGVWARNVIGSPLNNMAIVDDFDNDGKFDILGTGGKGSESNSNFVWAHNIGSGSFDILSNIEPGDGDFLQGVDIGSLGENENPKTVLSWHAANKGIQALEVPSNPMVDTWAWSRISPISQDEALSLGDVDRDTDLDILLGTIWLENRDGLWPEHLIHDTSGAPNGERDPDRNLLADINKDGRLDAVVGYEAISINGKLAWYEQGPNAGDMWIEHVIANIVGPMSLDVADMDMDGDLDVIAGEHNLKNPATAKLFVFENIDGKGNQWAQIIVGEGDEHHDGAQTVDIDGDGDLDIVSIGWGHSAVLLYENVQSTCVPSVPPGKYNSFLPVSVDSDNAESVAFAKTVEDSYYGHDVIDGKKSCGTHRPTGLTPE